MYERLIECALRTKTHIRNGYKFDKLSEDDFNYKKMCDQYNDFDTGILQFDNNCITIGDTEYLFPDN